MCSNGAGQHGGQISTIHANIEISFEKSSPKYKIWIMSKTDLYYYLRHWKEPISARTWYLRLLKKKTLTMRKLGAHTHTHWNWLKWKITKISQQQPDNVSGFQEFTQFELRPGSSRPRNVTTSISYLKNCPSRSSIFVKDTVESRAYTTPWVYHYTCLPYKTTFSFLQISTFWNSWLRPHRSACLFKLLTYLTSCTKSVGKLGHHYISAWWHPWTDRCTSPCQGAVS